MNNTPRDNTLKIGDLQLDSKSVLAPLAGYTDLSFRTIARRLGAGYCATEVTLASSINLSPKLRNRLIQITPEDHPLAGQIMGKDPEQMAIAAAHLVRMGCDVIDLNFACPVRKALRRGRGGHMMRDPERAISIIKAVAKKIEGVPLTIKLRQGYDDGDLGGDVFYKLAECAFDNGFKAVCVHGRTVDAAYRGPASWEFIRNVKQHFADKVIIGSGDLHTAADGVKMLDACGVDGVSFARGALGNPWIFSQFDEIMAGNTPTTPSLTEQARVMCEHFELCRQLFGPKRGPKMMYRFSIRYSKMHPRPKAVRTAFINNGQGSDFAKIMADYYGCNFTKEDQCQ